MAPQKSKVEMPGVASGKELSTIPTGDDVSAMDRVNALVGGSISEDSGYDVNSSFSFYSYSYSSPSSAS